MSAKSKAQRRLFALALALKRGNLDKKYLDKMPEQTKEAIKDLSELSEETLRKYAGTNQKKRRKDGSVGKRNAIPEKVKQKKK